MKRESVKHCTRQGYGYKCQLFRTCQIQNIVFVNSIPPKISPTKSNTSTFGTKHFFVGDSWVSRHITRQVFDFVEGLFGIILGDTSNHVFGFVGFWGVQGMKVML